MKSILIILAVMLFPVSVFAKEPSLAEVLEWKYGAVANTKEAEISSDAGNGMMISEWRHPSIPKPSTIQIQQDFLEYKNFKKNKKDAEDADEAALKGKMKLNDAELKALKRALEKV